MLPGAGSVPNSFLIPLAMSTSVRPTLRCASGKFRAALCTQFFDNLRDAFDVLYAEGAPDRLDHRKLSDFHNGRSKLNEAPKKMPPLVQWGQKAER